LAGPKGIDPRLENSGAAELFAIIILTWPAQFLLRADNPAVEIDDSSHRLAQILVLLPRHLL
jgi:hypothetical protein